MIDEVIALIRRQPHGRRRPRRPDGPARDRRDPGQRDPRHAAAPAGRPGAAEDHRRARRAAGEDRRVQGDPGLPERQRQIISEELAEIVDKYGDDRRTKLVPFDGDMSIEDLIAEEDIVVTITRGGYAKRTKTDLYRSQKRGGKGVRGAAAASRTTSSTTSSSPPRTTGCCSSPTRAGSTGPRRTSCRTPAATRAASTWPTCWPSSRTSGSPRSSTSRDYEVAPYLVLATKRGLVKKTALNEYDSSRGGRRHRDQPARGRRADRAPSWCSAEDDLLLVSSKAQCDPVHRHRRGAAADGPGHLRRDRHEVPRGRRTARR